LNTIDFTYCPRVAGRAYNGANGKKIAVSYQDAVWILKFPADVHNRPNDQSYSNSCISEHLGSTIYRMLGIPAQETLLGTHTNGREKLVCACKDFTTPGIRLHDFCSIKNTVLEGESGGTGTELSDVLSTIEQQTFMDPTEVMHRFWQMFVVDAWLGNFDRHNGNWGFLVNETTGETHLAPVFDCGSCLLPQADDRIMQLCLEDEREMNARIFSFPASMLKIDGKKIGYYDFLQSDQQPAMLLTVREELQPKIAALDIAGLITNTPYLTDLQRQFYTTYLTARREALFSNNL